VEVRTKKAVAPMPATQTQADIFSFSYCFWVFDSRCRTRYDKYTSNLELRDSYRRRRLGKKMRKPANAEAAVTPGCDWSRNLGVDRAHQDFLSSGSFTYNHHQTSRETTHPRRHHEDRDVLLLLVAGVSIQGHHIRSVPPFHQSDFSDRKMRKREFIC
jgi:hypothetical protein